MTPAELTTIKNKLGLTRKELGQALGLTSKRPQETVGRWERGDDQISGPVAQCMRYMAKYGIIDNTH